MNESTMDGKPFQNNRLVLDELIKVPPATYQALDKSYPAMVLVMVFTLQLQLLLVPLVFMLLVNLGVVDSRFGEFLVPVASALAVWFVIWYLLAWYGAKAKLFAMREHDILFRSGLFWMVESIQPLRRLQHVELKQGIIEKRFGLSRLLIYSAGTGLVTFQIPGLVKQDAEKIRQYILDYQTDFSTLKSA